MTLHLQKLPLTLFCYIKFLVLGVVFPLYKHYLSIQHMDSEVFSDPRKTINTLFYKLLCHINVFKADQTDY